MAKASVGLFVSDARIRGRWCAAGTARDDPGRRRRVSGCSHRLLAVSGCSRSSASARWFSGGPTTATAASASDVRVLSLTVRPAGERPGVGQHYCFHTEQAPRLSPLPRPRYRKPGSLHLPPTLQNRRGAAGDDAHCSLPARASAASSRGVRGPRTTGGPATGRCPVRLLRRCLRRWSTTARVEGRHPRLVLAI
jgi:hypothetical protein